MQRMLEPQRGCFELWTFGVIILMMVVFSLKMNSDLVFEMRLAVYQDVPPSFEEGRKKMSFPLTQISTPPLSSGLVV